MPSEIEKYQGFKAELAIAETFEELKFIESKAAAAAEFARKNKIGLDEQNQWGRFRVEIEAKKGLWLDEKFPPNIGRMGSNREPINMPIPKKESTQARNIFRNPEPVKSVIAKIESSGKVVTPSLVNTELKKEQRQVEIKEQNVTSLSKFEKLEFEKVCDIRNCSIQELLNSVKPDAIITDPPYPKEFLPLYEQLAKLSICVSLVAVMCGQSYLPEILHTMSKYLKYRWTIAYLTPGGQSVQQWVSKVNTFWKPVLLFGDSIEWFGDVAKSKVNDNDKRFHNWGQSESGMYDLVERLTKPGQLVCDPFLGAGTTGVVSLELKRRFVGCDIKLECVTKSIERCQNQFVK